MPIFPDPPPCSILPSRLHLLPLQPPRTTEMQSPGQGGDDTVVELHSGFWQMSLKSAWLALNWPLWLTLLSWSAPKLEAFHADKPSLLLCDAHSHRSETHTGLTRSPPTPPASSYSKVRKLCEKREKKMSAWELPSVCLCRRPDLLEYKYHRQRAC